MDTHALHRSCLERELNFCWIHIFSNNPKYLLPLFGHFIMFKSLCLNLSISCNWRKTQSVCCNGLQIQPSIEANEEYIGNSKFQFMNGSFQKIKWSLSIICVDSIPGNGFIKVTCFQKWNRKIFFSVVVIFFLTCHLNPLDRHQPKRINICKHRDG